MKIVICTALVAFSLGLGNAFAQAPAPATGTPAAGTQTKSDADKKAISKACSGSGGREGPAWRSAQKIPLGVQEKRRQAEVGRCERGQT